MKKLEEGIYIRTFYGIKKLEEGMYVRTIYGIKKIDSITCGQDIRFDNTDGFDEIEKSMHNCDGIKYQSDFWQEIVIGNPSSSIMDLIEEGDYINGSQLLLIDYATDREGNRDKLHFHFYFEDSDKDINEYYESLHIYSILTKERFESMAYKVEE